MLSLPANATLGTTGGDVCAVLCYATYKEDTGAASNTFDEGWGTRWWRNVDQEYKIMGELWV